MPSYDVVPDRVRIAFLPWLSLAGVFGAWLTRSVATYLIELTLGQISCCVASFANSVTLVGNDIANAGHRSGSCGRHVGVLDAVGVAVMVGVAVGPGPKAVPLRFTD